MANDARNFSEKNLTPLLSFSFSQRGRAEHVWWARQCTGLGRHKCEQILQGDGRDGQESDDCTDRGKLTALLLGKNHGGPSWAAGVVPLQVLKEVGALSGVGRVLKVTQSAFYCHHMLEILNAFGNKMLPPGWTDLPQHCSQVCQEMRTHEGNLLRSLRQGFQLLLPFTEHFLCARYSTMTFSTNPLNPHKNSVTRLLLSSSLCGQT